jgi:hypothetical protein
VTLWSEGFVYQMPDGRILNEDPRPTDEPTDGIKALPTSTEIPARWFFYSYGKGGPFAFLPHAEAVLGRHLGSNRRAGLWRT